MNRERTGQPIRRKREDRIFGLFPWHIWPMPRRGRWLSAKTATRATAPGCRAQEEEERAQVGRGRANPFLRGRAGRIQLRLPGGTVENNFFFRTEHHFQIQISA